MGDSAFARVDDSLAGLGLHVGQWRMLEAGQKIIVKLTFQPTVTRAACIQDNEISVTDVLRLGSVIK